MKQKCDCEISSNSIWEQTKVQKTKFYKVKGLTVRIDGPRGGGVNWAFFKFLKQIKATLTYAMLVGHQFTNRITKLPTQAKRDKTK